jgi:hypothetical protein
MEEMTLSFVRNSGALALNQFAHCLGRGGARAMGAVKRLGDLSIRLACLL